MKKVLFMMSLLLSVGLFSACSNNDENDFFDGGLPASEGFNEEPSISFSESDLNKLQITEIMGDFWSITDIGGRLTRAGSLTPFAVCQTLYMFPRMSMKTL